jgi:DNA-binding CsgD family transcriptional regulator
MQLVERDDELAVLDELFERCLRGTGSVAVINGPLASGKTALLHAFVERSVKDGAIFLGAVGSRAERTLPLGVIDQLFQSVDLPSAGAERIARLLVDGGLGPTVYNDQNDPAGPVAASVMRGLHEALRDIAEGRPVLIGVDDAHFIDAASLQCLLHLIRRLSSSRVLIVFGGCFQSGQAQWRFNAEILRLPNCRHIKLRPLSPNGVAGVLSERLDHETADRLAPAFHRLSGGNPLLVRALADDHLAVRGKTPPEPAAGDAFARAVLSCLYRGEPVLLEVSRALAMLGESFSVPLLGRLLDLDPESAAQAIEELKVAGLPQSGRFREESTRLAVLGSMPPEDRKAMHSRAAYLLHESGAAATTIAEHLVAADDVQPWAAPVLRDAAEQVLADGMADLAVSHLRLAHRVCVDEQERAVIMSTLVGVLWRINPAATKHYLPELTAAVRAGHLKGQQAALMFGLLLWYGRVDEAIAVLDSLQEDDGTAPRQSSPADGAQSLGELRLWLPYFYPGMFDRDPSAPVREETPVNAFASVYAPHRRASVALDVMLTSGADADVVADAEQILRDTRLGESTVKPVLAALTVLLHADRPDKAITWCDFLLGGVDQQQMPVWNALITVAQAAIHYRQGDLAKAESRGREALTLISADSWGAAVAAPLAVMIRTTTAMGRYEEAAAYLNLHVPPAAFQTPCGPHYLSARGHYYLATGHFDAALQDFEACGELMSAWRFDSPAFVPWRSDAAQALVCQNLIDRASALIDEQLAMLGPGRPRTRAITLRAKAATVDADQRVQLLRESAEAFQKSGDLLGLACALADLCQAHEALGELDLAVTVARRAGRLADQCGARPLMGPLARITGEPEEGTGDSPLLTMLSDAEKKVAVLATKGHTNRQIASQLYITVSTVEQHLTRVYRKLAVNRRSQLSVRLQSGLADWRRV